ncbi:MAG: glycosyltransferase family 4 protein [Syntrophobacterales bacterium]|nr:glycosyltransferase family 4 protein [Syntrophobacterales bacterium]
MAKTILHVIDALDYGGAQKLIFLLGKYWPRETAITLVAVLQDRCGMISLFEEAKIPVIVLGRSRPTILKPWSFISYGLKGIRDIASLCWRNKVDVLVLHLSDAEFMGIPAGIIAKVPKIYIVSHVRELLPQRKKGDLRNVFRRILLRFLYRKVTGLIAVSEEIAEVLSTFSRGGRVITILNAIDTKTFQVVVDRPLEKEALGLNPDVPVLLCVGRLSEEKGHIYAISALEKLLACGIFANLVLVGDGPLRGLLEKEVMERSIGQNVFFLGPRSDVSRLLAMSDIFLLPSLYEGTSLALLEAMAAGKPIVTTDLPPHRKILKPGETALLVPPKDPEALAEAIEELLNNPQWAEEMGKKVAEIALEKYDIHRLVSILEHLWI